MHQVDSELRGAPRRFGPEDETDILQSYGFAQRTPEQAMAHLDALMARVPKRKTVLSVFRGEQNADRRAKLAGLAVGQSFEDAAYLSTSLGPSYAFYAFAAAKGHADLMMINVPPSVRGLYIGDHNNTGEHTELEFLIDRGTRYTLRERRIIPNKNPYYRNQPVYLSIWDASR